ncbi:MAG: portal protein [Candidatus Actinomarinaceae bacterium]
MAIKLFGFTLGKKDQAKEQPTEQASFALPNEAIDDGAVTVQNNAYYGTYVDLEGSVRNELELITRYREMSNHPELDAAIDDIVNEAITHDLDGKSVDINVENLKQPDSIKKRIIEEFNNIKHMLNYGNLADDLFKRWYIDGRLYFHIVVNDKKPKEGIKELRYIDPRKIRKVREIKKDRDPKTGAMIIKSIGEYYIYNDKGTTTQTYTANMNSGLRIATDAIIYCSSGMMDARNTFVISYLHKAIKPLNNLRMIEDAIVIYRISRARERRIFYIDVGNLPKGKAEQYLRDVMIKYRNKMVYDASTGELRDDRKHKSMLEDFWLPRREGGKGTEITTLPAGQNLGELEDVKYFQKKLLQSLNVPISRLEPQQGGMIGLGRVSEVTRDEVKFNKFIIRLRNKFAQTFDHALRVQLSLKGIMSVEEWDIAREDIYYDFKKDNNFSEMREAELLRERLNLLGTVDPYIGRYYSTKWVKKNVLQMSDEDIMKMDKEMKKEGAIIQQPEVDQDGIQTQTPQPPNGSDPSPNNSDNLDTARGLNTEGILQFIKDSDRAVLNRK